MPISQLNYEEGNIFWNVYENILSTENKTIFAYGLLLFIIPLFPLHQLIIGAIVNALLIKSAISMKTKNVFLLALIPSIAAMAGGLLFGGFSSAMIYMIPFIWAGNFVIMVLMRKMFIQKKKNYWLSSILGTTTKTALLFSAAITMLSFGLVPVLFLTAFGIIQFVTAIMGSILVFMHGRIVYRK